jgi:type I restriction enzyme S subunit
LNSQVLGKIQVSLPVKEEQEKIADFLTSLDSKVDLINKELEQTKLFKKSLLQQMFV